MYAVIATGAKQYMVNVGDTIYIEKLDAADNDIATFDALIYVNGDNVQIGSPILDNVKVTGRVIRHLRGKKVIVFKYKPKKNIRKKQGHRQPYTAVEIMNISSSDGDSNEE